MGKFPPETEKPVPLAVTLFTVSAPVPDDVTVNAFDVGLFTKTVPNETVVGLTVIAGEEVAGGTIFITKVFHVQPYPATMVTFCVDFTEPTAAVNGTLL